MDDLKIELLGQLSKLEVKPGDRFVLMIDCTISTETQKRIQEVWKHFFANSEEAPELLILESGMKLGVIREAA